MLYFADTGSWNLQHRLFAFLVFLKASNSSPWSNFISGNACRKGNKAEAGKAEIATRPWCKCDPELRREKEKVSGHVLDCLAVQGRLNRHAGVLKSMSATWRSLKLPRNEPSLTFLWWISEKTAQAPSKLQVIGNQPGTLSWTSQIVTPSRGSHFLHVIKGNKNACPTSHCPCEDPMGKFMSKY